MQDAAELPQKKACRCIAVQMACRYYKRVCDAMLRHVQQLTEFVATVDLENPSRRLGGRPARIVFLGGKLLIAGTRSAVVRGRVCATRLHFRVSLANAIE
jgi:hypothetical protein